MITKYAHIGFPKCFSTSLQRDFFSMHPQLLHLGIGCGDNIKYIDDDILVDFEVHLQTSRKYLYEEQKIFIKNRLQNYFERAKSEGYGAVGVSLESFTYQWAPDQIDVSEKAQRLCELFGENTKVIMIIRNQMDLLKSWYGEMVKMGYAKSYSDFIEYTYKYQDRSMMYDLMYDKVLTLYERLFKKENILIIPAEGVRGRGKELVKDEQGRYLLIHKISQHLDVDYPENISLGLHNPSLPPVVAKEKMLLNREPDNQHDLGHGSLGVVQSHRMVPFFTSTLKVDPPKEATEDVIKKRKLIKLAYERAEGKDPDDFYKISDPSIEKALVGCYKNSNKALQKLLDFSLLELEYDL